MPEPLTYLERLREIALDQHGYVMAAQAAKLGIPRVELVKLADGVLREMYVVEAETRRMAGRPGGYGVAPMSCGSSSRAG